MIKFFPLLGQFRDLSGPLFDRFFNKFHFNIVVVQCLQLHFVVLRVFRYQFSLLGKILSK